MSILGIPLSFVLFALILISVAIFHKYSLKVAVIGLIIVTIYTFFFESFKGIVGIEGLVHHLHHESILILNLLALLVGFSLLADHFEKSYVTNHIVKILPKTALGPFLLLVLIFVLSSFLDNIAAAMIGGTIVAVIYSKRVHIGYLAAIVAASNAGGSGSVVGDTTTTMIWLAGKSPLQVLHAYIGAITALLFFGFFASKQQFKYYQSMPVISSLKKDKQNKVVTKTKRRNKSKNKKNTPAEITTSKKENTDYIRLYIVISILVVAFVTNIHFTLKHPDILNKFPVLGMAIWVVLLLTAFIRKPNWSIIPNALKGAIFLLSLVLCASMMPVEKLPVASAISTLLLGFVSSVFDNIPLTALALEQGGYDWGFLAFAVGFGGSMLWFGSSAGVALSNMYPEAKSVVAWVRSAWYIPVAYVLGYIVMNYTIGWHPDIAYWMGVFSNIVI